MNEEKLARLKDTKLFVCDMDGTIYLSDTPIDGALEFVKCIKAMGKKLFFFTNNASRTKAFYKEKLLRLGFGDLEVMTAGDVTINYLNTFYSGKRVFLVGTEALKQEMLGAGVNVVDDACADIVVSSFDTELTYKKLHIACDAIRNGALYLCTHPDFNCPLKDGAMMPDSGAIAALITASTGKAPKYLGKPYSETAEAIARLGGVDASQCASIGDRLYTDIALAKNSGMLSVLVLSGETKKSDINTDNAPDLVFDTVLDICRYI